MTPPGTGDAHGGPGGAWGQGAVPVDPGTMTQRELFGEISTILARGYERLSVNSRNHLDDGPAAEAPCVHPVNTPMESKE